jgi:hypothetical protein
VRREEVAADGHLELVEGVLEDVVAVELVDHAERDVERGRARVGAEDELDARERLEALEAERVRLELLDARRREGRDLFGDCMKRVERRPDAQPVVGAQVRRLPHASVKTSRKPSRPRDAVWRLRRKVLVVDEAYQA